MILCLQRQLCTKFADPPWVNFMNDLIRWSAHTLCNFYKQNFQIAGAPRSNFASVAARFPHYRGLIVDEL